MKPVELDGKTTSLSVTDFPRENSGISGFVFTTRAKIVVTKPFAEQLLQLLSRAVENNVSRRIVTFRGGPQLSSILIDDPFADHDHDVLLKFVKFCNPMLKPIHIKWCFRNENNIWLAIGGAEWDEPRVTTHHFDNRDSPVAFCGRTNSFDTLHDNKNRRGKAWSHVIDNFVQANRWAYQ